MKLVAPKTMSVLVHILDIKEFTQRELWSERCKHKIALGQVNKVVQWLETNAFVQRKHGKYVLTNPTGLLRAISLFRSMNDLRVFSASIDMSKEKVISYLQKKDIVFCLGTALEKYSSYFRSDEISYYALEHLDIQSKLSSQKEGLTRVSGYNIDYVKIRDPKIPNLNALTRDFLDAFFISELDKTRYTSRVQTVVDLFCDGKAYYTKELLKEHWGVEL
jgi:hypothetical protein